jgi:hypothetical protein
MRATDRKELAETPRSVRFRMTTSPRRALGFTAGVILELTRDETGWVK